jgi:hypothetical protein
MKTLTSILISGVLFLLLATDPALSQSKVTFQVNISSELEQGLFDPEEHHVELSGTVYPLSLNRYITLEPSEDDHNLYSAEVIFPIDTVNKDVNYMFRLNLGNRFLSEDLPRSIRISEHDTKLDALYFNSYAW